MLPKWLQEETIKGKSIRQEKELAKEIGAKLTPSSGATSFAKGDMKLEDWLIESKVTQERHFSLKLDTLHKINDEAIRERRKPLLILEMSGERYYIFRSQDCQI